MEKQQGDNRETRFPEPCVPMGKEGEIVIPAAFLEIETQQFAAVRNFHVSSMYVYIYVCLDIIFLIIDLPIVPLPLVGALHMFDHYSTESPSQLPILQHHGQLRIPGPEKCQFGPASVCQNMGIN